MRASTSCSTTRARPTTKAARKAIFEKFQAIVEETVPGIIAYSAAHVNGVSKKVEGFQLHTDAVARAEERLAQALTESGTRWPAYIARRIVFIALVLVAVSMLVFAITTLLPANVAYLILGPFAPPEQVRALELKLGLTDPIWQQYLRWAGSASSAATSASRC